MKIIPLGTNGFFPSFGRATACYIIPFSDKLIILDAGSGLFRFAESQVKRLLSGIKEIDLFLSHYHLDHTFGFYAAFKLFKDKKVKVFSQSKRQIFWEFVDLKHFPVDYHKVHKNFSWSELKIGENKIGNYQVTVRKQYHRGEGSLAFHFTFLNKQLAYLTDSEPSKESVRFVRGVDILLHEWERSKEKDINGKIKLEKQFFDGHVTTIGAAQTAKLAKVGKLVLIHHNPFADSKVLDEQLKIAQKIFPKTEMAKDLDVINF